MEPSFFTTKEEFREWLKKHHATEKELLAGFYKTGSGKPSMSWSESVDQALCFGWIDGVRKSIDHESYSIRFTPRKPGSIWSLINIRKVDELSKAGLMMPEGQKAFDLRKEERSGVYSHENGDISLAPAYKIQFTTHKTAWDFFEAQPPSYKKVMIHWIMSAKQEKTRLSRLEKVIAKSEQLRRLE